jgi:hypothetical protein
MMNPIHDGHKTGAARRVHSLNAIAQIEKARDSSSGTENHGLFIVPASKLSTLTRIDEFDFLRQLIVTDRTGTENEPGVPVRLLGVASISDEKARGVARLYSGYTSVSIDMLHVHQIVVSDDRRGKSIDALGNTCHMTAQADLLHPRNVPDP